MKNPYLRLMRLDKPTGIALLLWPALWSIGLATSGFDLEFISFCTIFTIGAIIMRSAGCVINDIIDKDIDKKVKRTRKRPLASGELRVNQAFALLGLLLAIGLGILLILNVLTVIIGCGILFFVVIYPYMKRWTYWPQFFLAITFNIGAVMGWSAVNNEISLASLLLYVAGIFWTLGYDTIYAHQDKKDDAKLGIKSTALWMGKNTKTWVSAFYTLTVFFLFVSACLTAECHIFLSLALVVGLCQLFWQINTVRLSDPVDCMRKFKSNIWFGLIVFIGIVVDKLYDYISHYNGL